MRLHCASSLIGVSLRVEFVCDANLPPSWRASQLEALRTLDFDSIRCRVLFANFCLAKDRSLKWLVAVDRALSNAVFDVQ